MFLVGTKEHIKYHKEKKKKEPAHGGRGEAAVIFSGGSAAVEKDHLLSET